VTQLYAGGMLPCKPVVGPVFVGFYNVVQHFLYLPIIPDNFVDIIVYNIVMMYIMKQFAANHRRFISSYQLIYCIRY